MFDKKKGVQLIGSARHILLNDLQLIKGYLSIKQPEKAMMIIDQITERLRHQSRLSNLNIPKCCFYLTTYRWSASPFDLTIEVSGSESDFSSYDQMLFEFFSSFFPLLEKQATETVNNEMLVSFETSGSALNIRMTYAGELNQPDQAEKRLEGLILNQSLMRVKHYITKNRINGKMRWVVCLSIK
ncbi:stage 0 sporulation initiation phosphotransferase B [Sporolactobacillus sp. THM7-4]|nr:stage 0 sporulation initiation phosphotransferase B [Sporolactobacillus sp. THM7-4]